jgi:hypothetical protein
MVSKLFESRGAGTDPANQFLNVYHVKSKFPQSSIALEKVNVCKAWKTVLQMPTRCGYRPPFPQ